jgi:hypothetical protein
MQAPGWLAEAGKTLTVRAVELIFVGLLIFGFLSWERHRADATAAIARAETDKAIAAAVAQVGAAQGTLVKEREASKLLGSQLAKAYQALKAKGATLESHTDTKVEVSDSTPGGLVAATPTAPATWQDEYHRFALQLPNGPLRRHQLFGLEGIAVRSPDGSIRAADYNFKEYDPETKAEIPIEGATLKTTFQFVEEKAEGPGPFHLRGVAAVDQRGAPGGGIAINPWRGLTVGLLALYSPRDKDLRGALHVGYRLFGSTIAAGPYIGASTKGGGLLFGAAVTIEVTR